MDTDTPTKESSLPLDDVMLAMDVVDTLRHRQDLVARELEGAARESQLIEKLKDIYRQQGIDVPDAILKQGVDALSESRFVYAAPEGGLAVTLARLYVSRKVWGRWVFGVAVAVLLLVGAYMFAYRPYQAAQIEAARVELSDTLPQQMDQLYNRIYEETKVQTAVSEAADYRSRGQAAAKAGDRAGAVAAIDNLQELLNTLQRDYTLKIVNREGVRSGFWTFPEINTDATNYYVVVEAISTDSNEPLTLPVKNEENGQIEKVSIWGIRVPEGVYRAVEADKRDDGIIERNIVGVKQYGFLNVDYVVPVLGGTVTRW